MDALVIGYGSIGSRHTRVLVELGCRVAVVSQRDIDFAPCYKSLQIAIQREQPDYVIIANKTNEHYSALLELAELAFRGVILVEKPLFHERLKMSIDSFDHVFVAYDMRWDPLLQKLATMLKSERVLSVQAYAGQYLPQWRPQRDYRLSYSSRKAEGGGVLRDLSHELDYLNWLLDGWKSVTALGGHFSHLEIDSDDMFSIMMTTQKCPIVTIQMNYLDRFTQREVLINTDRHVFKVDFIRQTFQIDDQIETFVTKGDDTYRMQHQAIINKEYGSLCSFEEGLEVVSLIHSAEKTAYSSPRIWISK